MGGTYTYLGGSHAGLLWLTNPRLADRYLRLSTVAGYDNRIRVLYDQAGRAIGGWTRHRAQAAITLQAVPDPRRWVIGGGLIVGRDAYDRSLLTSALRASGDANGITPPSDRVDLISQLNFRLGRVDTTDYFQRGAAVKGTVEMASSAVGSGMSFVRATVHGYGFLRVGDTGNLGARLSLAAISAPVPERMFYVGGLSWKRGFAEGRYRGTRVWNLNLEGRVSSVHRRLVALQHVLFFDIGDVAYDAGDLVGLSRVPPFSLGTGVRFILPMIARFIARLDVAIAFGAQTEWRVSFGSAQFF